MFYFWLQQLYLRQHVIADKAAYFIQYKSFPWFTEK